MNLKHKSLKALGLLAIMAWLPFTGCEKETYTLGDAPSQADADFSFAPSADNDNIIEFTANPSMSGTNSYWDFGNNSKATGAKATATYPFAGTYTVTHTVSASGGIVTTTKDVTIAQDDPSLIENPLFDILTGGPDGPGFKTWVIDSNNAAHFGVGPNPIGAAGRYPEWYAAGPNEKTGAGMYDDRYTFSIQGFTFDMVTNGDVYVNSAHAGIPPFDDTTASPVADFIANFPDQLGETWTLEEDGDTTISISGSAMIGYWAGSREYEVVIIEENELFLRYVDQINTNLSWYIRLIPEGL